MGIYINDGSNNVVKAYPSCNWYPILFGYTNNGSAIKKFYDISDALDYLEFRVTGLFLDKSSAAMENVNPATLAELSGYGSVTIASNYVQVNSTKSGTSLWVYVNCYAHYKSISDWQYFEDLINANKRFADSVMSYSFSVTGYCQYRTSSSTSSYGYLMNRAFGEIMIGNEACSTTSTITKALTNSDASSYPQYYAFAYVGSGRSSGSQTIISKMTFNSATINGVSIPVKVTSGLS